jgi:hypothetical protein
MLHSEAIEFLDEIAINNPAILQSSSYINLKKTEKEDIEIVIHCHLAGYDLEMINHMIKARNLTIINLPKDVWVIY